MRSIRTGFTLLEILVVIAIIGLLSSIIMASLSTAKAGAQEAALKESFISLRSLIATYYNEQTSMCLPTSPVEVTLQNISIKTQYPGEHLCASGDFNTSWMVYVRVNDTQVFCMDNNGEIAQKVQLNLPNGTTCQP